MKHAYPSGSECVVIVGDSSVRVDLTAKVELEHLLRPLRADREHRECRVTGRLVSAVLLEALEWIRQLC